MTNTHTGAASLDTPGSIAGLIAEIQRYLEAVAFFRALECEPTWRS